MTEGVLGREFARAARDDPMAVPFIGHDWIVGRVIAVMNGTATLRLQDEQCVRNAEKLGLAVEREVGPATWRERGCVRVAVDELDRPWWQDVTPARVSP
jgi:hypothetical protein